MSYEPGKNRPPRRCRGRLWGLLWSAAALPLNAAPPPALSGAEKPPPQADILWTGSWEAGGNLVNRGDLRLNALDFTARTQITDRRSTGEAALPLWEHAGEGLSALSGGLYHRATGSRLLYGIIDEWGLSARLRNPWAKAPPFAETRRPAAADLKTEPSSTRGSEAYLYLSSPRLGMFRGYASAQTTGDLPSLGGGLEAEPAKKTLLRIEGFYTGKHLDPYRPAAWFSENPPLPERDFSLKGLSLFFTAPLFGIAADGAYSETFAYGRGFYGNLALRLGDRPWRLSLAADAAGSRFADRDGSPAGKGFRGAARLERRGRGSSLLRLDAVLRSGGFGEPFDRASALFSYRFPAALWDFPLRPSKFSLEASRKGVEPGEILDTLGGSLGFNLGPLRSVFETALSTYAGEGEARRFNTLKSSGELSYYGGPLQLRAKLGYTGTAGKRPAWETAFYGSIRGKPGRFSLKIASEDFPRSWTLGISWRLEGKIPPGL
jgi:hypothetical protein